MSQEDIQRLAEAEAKLREQLASIQKQKAEAEVAEREREEAEKLTAPITFTVVSQAAGSLVLEGPFREDTYNIMKAVPGRRWMGYGDDKAGKNAIPISEFEKLEQKLLLRPNVTVEWAKGVKEDLEWYLNAPPWHVTVHPDRRNFIAKMGPRQSYYQLLGHMPGSDWDYTSRSWKIPRTEGWRIFQALEKIEGVVYDDDAAEIIFDQVKVRAELDKLAHMEDVELEVDLQNGNKLRAFQKVGVKFIQQAGGRVLVCDGTGLGKTWQALAFSVLEREKDEKYQTIVVAKAANIPNWEREIKRLTGIDPITCKGGKPEFFTLQTIVTERAPYVIISYDTLASYQKIEEEREDKFGNKVPVEIQVYPWQGVFKAASPDLIVMDEAHQIKNPDTHRFKALKPLALVPAHILPMTASPVLNRTEELWPLLYMLDPETFKVHDQFLNTYTFGGRHPRNVKELHEMLRPRFIRRKKSDVLKDLPAINRIIRYHDLTDPGKASYEEVLQGIYTQLEEFDPSGHGGEQMKVMSILAQITRLKQICAADKVDDTVDIAKGLIDENIDDPDAKVLLFSQFKGTAHAIYRALGPGEAVCTVRRSATDFTSMTAIERDALFERARNAKHIKYIVTTEAAKEGHNLEFCNWVIFNDPFWTPAAHDQCEGRAYGRLSNPHPIDSFYLVADVDVERWIMEMLEKKLNIINEAVEQIEATRDEFGSIGMELIKRMKAEMWRARR